MLTTIACLLISCVAIAEQDDHALQGWTRVFTEEFDGPAVDTSEWNVLNRRNSFNNEKQYYLPEQVSIHEGSLRLTATNEPFDGKAYRSGLVRTKQEWSHGRFEIRADLPTSQGMWPAIWLLAPEADFPWPTGGEIDIMENRGSQPTITSSAYHYQVDNTVPCCSQHRFVYGNQSQVGGAGEDIDYHAGYHDYAVEWEPGVLRFYVDGVRHFTVDETIAPVFDTRMSLILNLAVGGDFGGDPNGSTVFPQHFDIDYVRVWQRENGFVGLVNGGFDENRGSLADWNLFDSRGEESSILAMQDESLTGDSAMRLSIRSGADTFLGAYQGVAIEGGETLRLRARSLVPGGETLTAEQRVAAKVEFYTEFGGQFDSPQYLGQEVLDIAHAGTTPDVWQHNEFVVDAPAGAVEARVTFVGIDGGATNGAVYIDAASLVEVEPLAGDYNFDGRVDAADYTVWRDTLGSTTRLAADHDRDRLVEPSDANAWRDNYGRQNGPAAVPEPATGVLLIVGAVALGRRRRSTAGSS